MCVLCVMCVCVCVDVFVEAHQLQKRKKEDTSEFACTSYIGLIHIFLHGG